MTAQIVNCCRNKSVMCRLRSIGGLVLIDNELCVQLLKDEIETKGKIRLTVHGDSMLPLLKDGHIITIEKCNQYNIGDIVAYCTIIENKLNIIVHRVIFARTTHILAKGDNNSFIDPLKIQLSNILGKFDVRGLNAEIK